ncbi:MAG: biotin/lipoyl-binding protein [Candidatus Rokubacteria bacterium]|nr:biotin/lipoyl-binding protein [Candidatus Rokubacteria bacterium]
MRFVAELDAQALPVEVTEVAGRFRVRVGDEVVEVDARWPVPGRCSLLIAGAAYAADVTEKDGWFTVDVAGETYRIRVEEETRRLLRRRGSGVRQAGGQVLVAPMPGRVVHVAVREGQAVKAGDGLVVVEAMKMENEFKATLDGTVKEVRVRVGQTVDAGDVLVVVG